MASTLKGPALFLAQFAGDAAPFNSWDAICKWAGSLGYKGVQIPSWDGRLFDLAKAAASKTYADEVKGIARRHGVEVTELSTHLQGQLVAVHPAFDEAFDAFAPPAVHGKPKERQKWAVEQLMLAAKASHNLGLCAEVTFSGALAWPFVYPWPQRPAGLVDDSVHTNSRAVGCRSLDAHDEVGGLHHRLRAPPGRGRVRRRRPSSAFSPQLKATIKRCAINYDPVALSCCSSLDYLDFHRHLSRADQAAFHVKDAEFNPTGRQGFYSGYPVLGRPRRPASARSVMGRLTSPGSSRSSRST